MQHYERGKWEHCRHGARLLPLFVPESCDLGAKIEASRRGFYHHGLQKFYIWRAGNVLILDRAREMYDQLDRYTTSQERRVGRGTGILLARRLHSKSGKRVDVRQTVGISPTFGPECYTSRAEGRAWGGDLAITKSVDSALLELRIL